MDINENDLSGVDENLLTECVKKLKIVSLRNSCILVRNDAFLHAFL